MPHEKVEAHDEARRRDEVLKRMLNTKPQKHKKGGDSGKPPPKKRPSEERA
jgi:hypothetical protein